MSRDTSSLLPPDKGQGVSVYKLFLTVVWRWSVGYERSGCWLWVGRHQQSLILSKIWRVTILSDRGLRCWQTFVDFSWQFYSHVWDWIGSEKLWGESSWSVKKKDFFNREFILHFNRMTARSLPAQQPILFILLKSIIQTTPG